MEKLDEILRAEENARRTLSDAREQAASIAIKASNDAALALEESRTGAETRSAEIRSAALETARDDADRIASEAEASLKATVDAANARKADAVKAALAELVG